MRGEGRAIRIALLTEIPAPFRIPLFNALAAREDVELRVLFLAEEDPRRRHYRVYAQEFAFAWRVLPGWEMRRRGRWVVLNRGVLGELRRFRTDVVIAGGWNQPAFWSALAYARVRRRPLVAWIESTLRDERPGSAPLERAKRAFVRGCAAFLVPGRASAAYLSSLGVPEKRIQVAPNAIDPDIFGARVAELRRERERLRGELGRNGCVFLYVGRLDPEKGLDVLLRAFAEVPGELVLLGSGSEEERLRSEAPPRVRFLGPLSREQVLRWYAAADAFVLPSLSEPWGMVLNEAAAAGLPLVATDAAGAAHDLVEDGANGFRVPAGDERALCEALRRVAEDEGFRREAGAHSLEVARAFTPERWAASVTALARRLVG